MKKVSKIILAVGVISAMTASVFADSFINGGFESGTTNGWTLQSGNWSASNPGTLNNSNQSDSAVISNTNATDANTLGNLYEVLQGNDSFRLNNAAKGWHYSTLSQTVSNYTDANMYLGFAAVLENPNSGHTPAETPKFSFSIYDNTTHTTLYDISFNSLNTNGATLGVTWHKGLVNNGNKSVWYYSDWNVVHIDTSTLLGDTFTVSVSAYDCALGGHGGYAYVDSFQPTEPIANPGVTVNVHVLQANELLSTPEPTSVVMWSLGGLALLWGGKRRLFKPQA